MKNYYTLVLFFCFAWLFTAKADGVRASVGLTGVVRSVNKQLIPRASVVVVYEPSGQRRTATSDAAGSFLIDGLAVGGPYTVQVTQPDFQTETVRNVFLLEGQTANGTFVLHPVGEKRAVSTAPRAAAAGESARSAAASSAYHSATYIQQCRIIEPAAVAAASAPAPAFVAVARPATAPAPAARRPAPYVARKPAPRVLPPAAKGHYDSATGNYIYETGAPTTLKLPNGQKLAGIGANSTESLLHRFLASPSTKIDTVDLTQGWMSFDRVYFETGKATLTKESMSQLRNVVVLLQSYPSARVKLGGYTDSTGTYKINRQLSEARARTAWAALVEMGLSPARIEARGYGSNYAIASNQTVEGRAMNRRLSVKVLAK